jgi:hypothetical protein
MPTKTLMPVTMLSPYKLTAVLRKNLGEYSLALMSRSAVLLDRRNYRPRVNRPVIMVENSARLLARISAR